MPWKECSVMDERLRFIARLLERESMSDLCRQAGISRKTGYKIVNRYKPGHPQQNGRHERMHLTLKKETTRPPGANALQQQARLRCLHPRVQHRAAPRSPRHAATRQTLLALDTPVCRPA